MGAGRLRPRDGDISYDNEKYKISAGSTDRRRSCRTVGYAKMQQDGFLSPDHAETVEWKHIQKAVDTGAEEGQFRSTYP